MNAPNPADYVPADYVIETRGLTKRFYGFAAVSGVDLRVRGNSVHALIGPNGPGKTTMFNLITKSLPPTEGRILYDGTDITALGVAQVARRGIVRSFQISAIYPRMTVAEKVRIALQRPMGTSFHFWKPEPGLASLAPRVEELLDTVGLKAGWRRICPMGASGRWSWRPRWR